ncbi:MAG: ATP synthase F1 subunit delta [Thermotogae bacterium]|nr:ATP synthase F1 subunit delta [Thermotogota bacterium]
MKGSQIVAHKYANALYLSISEPSKIETYMNILEELSLLMKKERFRDFFMDPAIPVKAKMEFLSSIFTLDEMLENFLKIILEKKRFQMIDVISASFKSVVYQENDILQVRCISAKELEDDDLKKIKEVLKKKFRKRVHIFTEKDESLLAGVKLFFDSQLVDLTVKGELEKMLSQTLEGVRS